MENLYNENKVIIMFPRPMIEKKPTSDSLLHIEWINKGKPTNITHNTILNHSNNLPLGPNPIRSILINIYHHTENDSRRKIITIKYRYFFGTILIHKIVNNVIQLTSTTNIVEVRFGGLVTRPEAGYIAISALEILS